MAVKVSPFSSVRLAEIATGDLVPAPVTATS